MNLSDFPKVASISPRKAGNPRVLIVRLSAVGDCVQTMPLACAVREQWPDAHLTWVVEKGAAPLVEACDAVDQVIVLPKRFATSPSLLARLRRELRREPFHFTLDPQGLTKSGLVAWLSGARRRIGFSRPAAREINPWLQTELVASHARHRVPQYLDLLRPLGIDSQQVRFGLTIPPVVEAKVAEFIIQSALEGGYVALNPGAGWDSKRWPIECYAEVARHLATCGTPCVVTWGGAQERDWAETIVTQSRGAAVLAPPTSLLELAGLLQHSRIFVGSDTGPLHLAAALGTPCVALFGASSAVACGPYGSGHVTLQVAHDESAGRKRNGADNWAMRRITSDNVCAASELLLQSQNPRAAQSAAA
jgi:lipopolysaccharide heptosyltransferase I